MVRFSFSLILAVFIWSAASYSASSADPVANSSAAKVRAVYFHADWCSNCLVLRPKLEQAKLDTVDLPVQHITLDFTNAQTWDQAMETALDEDVVATYNAYAGTTGMVVLLAADTGERIDCVNKLFSVATISESFKQAVDRVDTVAPGSRDTGSIVCPPSRMRR